MRSAIIKSILILLLFVFLSNLIYAQQTGSFNTTIKFSGQARTLSFYVPEDYNSDIKYRLIVGLHGGGGSSWDYRDVLQPLSDPLNAIIVCPDNNGSQFQGAVANLIPESVNHALSQYNIDPDKVYLHGFSLNAYSTMYYGLKKIYEFNAIIPMHSIYYNEVSQEPFDWDSDVKSCICTGYDDSADNKKAYQVLINNGAKTYYNYIDGVGHTDQFPAFKDEMLECFSFFDSIDGNTASLDHQKIFSSYYFSIYPNPFEDFLFINMQEAAMGSDYYVSIYDMKGRILYNSHLIDAEDSSTYIVDTKSFGDGIYLVKIFNDRATYSYKLVK